MQVDSQALPSNTKHIYIFIVRRDVAKRSRSIESVLSQYSKFVKPAFDEYIRPTVKCADVIIPRGVENIGKFQIMDCLKKSIDIHSCRRYDYQAYWQTTGRERSQFQTKIIGSASRKISFTLQSNSDKAQSTTQGHINDNT